MPKREIEPRSYSEDDVIMDIRKDYHVIRNISIPSQKIIKAAIFHGGKNAVRLIDPRLMTAEMYGYFIKKFPSSFEIVPEVHKTPENCMTAVSLLGRNIQHVPNKTLELCVTAITLDPNVLNYISDEFRNEEVYYIAYKNGLIDFNAIPVDKRSKRLYLALVKTNSSNMNSVPDEMKTPDFYLDAVKINYNVIKTIPIEFITQEICDITIRSNMSFLKWIPKEMQTDEICLRALDSFHPDEYISLILSESPAVLKKKERIERYNKMINDFNRKHMGWGGPFGHPMMFDPMIAHLLDNTLEYEDEMQLLRDEMDILKREVAELKAAQRPTE